MCGRYSLFDDDNDPQIKKIIQQVKQNYPDRTIKTGEIFPTNEVPILISEENRLTPVLYSWGLPNFRNKSGVIINARAETAHEKQTFSQSLAERRCVIPSTGFYEWSQDESKRKYKFNLPGTCALYMAGIYNIYKNQPRFVILTTAANSSVVTIHKRMPVVLKPDELEEWVGQGTKFADILYRIPPKLIKTKVE